MIERHPKSFVPRVFTDAEIAYCAVGTAKKRGMRPGNFVFVAKNNASGVLSQAMIYQEVD